MFSKTYKKITSYFLIKIITIIFFLRKKIRTFRKVQFEYFSSKYMLATNKYFFILFGNDKFISKETYINEPHDYNLLKKSKKILKKRVTYLIDVGANIGTFCIPAVKDGGIKKCIAIEPVENINDILRSNIILNGLKKKIQVFDYVISCDTKENLVLKQNKNNYGDNKFKNIKDGEKKYKIQKLDYFINNFKTKNLLIKIDVQGFEGKVLLGGLKFIKKRVPILIELDKNFCKFANFNYLIKNIIKNYNFFVDLDQKKIKKSKIINFDFFLKNHLLNSDREHCNCLLF